MNVNEIKNQLFMDFKRYEHEIFMDVYDKILTTTTSVAKDTLLELKEKEIRYLVEYHQKTILNTLFFKNEDILLEYHRWLYRVYFYRNVDLDFFKYLNQLFQKISSHYIDQKNFFALDEYLKKSLQEHDSLVKDAPRKKILLDLEEDITELCNTILAGNKDKSYKILQKHVSNLNEFVVFFDTIIHKTMLKIGYMWEAGEISVAKEHLASNTIEDVLITFLDSFQADKPKETELFLSSAPNEHHGLGIKVAAIVLEKLGYKTTNLGVDLPSKEIVKAIQEFKPDIFLLVATMPTNRLDVALLISELQQNKQYITKDFQVWIAGNAFENMPQPEKVLKADSYIKNLQSLLSTLNIPLNKTSTKVANNT